MAVHPEYNGKRITTDPKIDEGRVYLVLDGVRCWIPNPDTYNNLFRDWNGIEQVLDITDIDRGPDILDGAMLVNQLHGPVGTPLYLIADGTRTKRYIANPATMDAYYFDWGKIVSVPAVVLEVIPQGPDININAQ